jgi:hypothetical protein
VVDLDRELGSYDWRFSSRNVWKAEQMLIDYPHRPIRTADARVDCLRRRYIAFCRQFPGMKPVRMYARRDRWTPLPREFRDGSRGRRRQSVGVTL